MHEERRRKTLGPVVRGDSVVVTGLFASRAQAGDDPAIIWTAGEPADGFVVVHREVPPKPAKPRPAAPPPAIGHTVLYGLRAMSAWTGYEEWRPAIVVGVGHDGLRLHVIYTDPDRRDPEPVYANEGGGVGGWRRLAPW